MSYKKLIIDALKDYTSVEFAETLADSLVHAYLYNKGTVSTIHLFQKYPKEIYSATKVLSNLGLIESKVRSKFAQIKVVVPAEYQEDMEIERYNSRLEKYALDLDLKEYSDTLIKRPDRSIEDNGPVRKGFNAKAKTTFRFDTDLILEHRDMLIKNIVKGLMKQNSKGKLGADFLADEANYAIIARDVLDYYITTDGTYNNSHNVSDQRGRAIYQSLSKVFNPISYKDARSLLIATEPVKVTVEDFDKLGDIYYAIAELTGQKYTKEYGAIAKGKASYNEKHLPELSADTLHEYMHLQRIYRALDVLFSEGEIVWDIPIEIDARASVLQIYGVISGDAKALRRTSVLGTDIIDPWFHPEVPRKLMKTITPKLYGSSAPFQNLAKAVNLSITKDQVRALQEVEAEGDFSASLALKDLLIKHHNICTPRYTVKIADDEYQIEVNRFKTAGTSMLVCKAYDTSAKKYKTAMLHQPKKVHDFDRFGTFLATGLVHNLDSQLMNKLCTNNPNYYMIPIHDAIITLPGQAKDLREQYIELLKELYVNREGILKSYLKSIGATSNKAKLAYMKMLDKVEEFNLSETSFNRACMK